MIDDPRAWLDAHVNMERGVGIPAETRRATAPTLDRIRGLLALLGDPQREYPVVHLTGTNGKTTTVRMVTALLGALGLSVGSYTSPHLERVNERLAYGSEPIADGDLDEVLRIVELAERSLDEPPSYFEILTAAAYRWFADLAVEVAVVEVGLGGTWDATNVAEARVAVVSNISIDHVEYLGPTRADIAREKAGIVEPGSTLVLGETDPDLEQLFIDRGPSRVLRRDVDFGAGANEVAYGGRRVDLWTRGGRYTDVLLPLHGAHQADNAALAVATAEAFTGFALDPGLVAEAFAGVRSPGRLEVVGRRPLVILDGAHNTAGAAALVVALGEEFATGPRTLVVGILREKDPTEMLAALAATEAARVVCCRPPSPRGRDPRDVAAAARSLGVPADAVAVIDDVGAAVDAAIAATPEHGEVLVAGSLYVVGAARAHLVGPG